MGSTKREPDSRSHEHEVSIDASPETVWKAITDAAELVNWFPLGAEVKPGAGGEITYDWEKVKGTSRIEVWDPPRHLRTGWVVPEGGGPEGTQLLVDWYLESEGGRTRLRLVHSGFGPGQEWDNEYHGTRRGWAFELRSLKHYLERHPVKRRSAFWLLKDVRVAGDEGWRLLFGPGGLAPLPSPATPRAGDHLDVTLSTGDRIEGEVIQCEPPHELGWFAANWKDGLIRLGYETFSGHPQLSIWASFWGVPEAHVEWLRERIETALARL